MLLKLIKTLSMPSGIHAEIVEVNSVLGNTHLADIFVLNELVPQELIYPLSVTRNALFIREREVGWQWSDYLTESSVMAYLRYVHSIREEIYLEVCEPEPDLPGYPKVDFNPKDYPIVMGIDEAVAEDEIADEGMKDILLEDIDLLELLKEQS